MSNFMIKKPLGLLIILMQSITNVLKRVYKYLFNEDINFKKENKGNENEKIK